MHGNLDGCKNPFCQRVEMWSQDMTAVKGSHFGTFFEIWKKRRLEKYSTESRDCAKSSLERENRE